jgi:hypothetical protein
VKITQAAPGEIAITPDSHTALVPNGNTNDLTPVDLTRSPPSPKPTVGVSGGLSPDGIAIARVPVKPPSVPVAASQQFGVPNQTDAFRVGPSGALEVSWVEGGGIWRGPLAISPPDLAPPGSYLAVSQQFGIPDQTDVFVVGKNGAIDVSWVRGLGTWHGPLTISPLNSSLPGAGLTSSPQFGIPNQTDVFVVGDNGAIDVSWVQGGGAWQRPLAISPANSSPWGAGLTSSPQFGIPNQTDVFVVGDNGAIDVSWVQGGGNWQRPLAISPANSSSLGAALTSSQQSGIPNQTDVFVVGNNGAIDVSWVQGGGTWRRPLGVTRTGFADPRAPLASSTQFGIPGQTDVFFVAIGGATHVSWVESAGAWKGPLKI